MSYVDGFVIAVRTEDKEKYRKFSEDMVAAFKEHGASSLAECWGDDVPHGKVTDFYRAVKAKDDETVVFSWIVWPDKATRETGMEKLMADPIFDPATNPVPFDGKRMIFGGFEIIVGEAGPAKTYQAKSYVGGFVLAVPTANKEKYRKYADAARPVVEKHGALSLAECWGTDVPRGEVTDFYRAVQAGEDEAIAFAWIVWPDKATRDAAMPKITGNPIFDPETNPMPLDGKRMIFGGFETIVDG